MQILFIGDIFGKPGREIARRAIPALVEQRGLDFVIANVENSAAGFGVTGDVADTILGYGVDVMTSGNHIWDKKEVLEYLPREPRLLRPGNFPAGVPGRGSIVGRTRTGEPVGVLNLMGRVFMTPLDDPFALALREVESLRAKTRVIFVDFHAEATSEKIAMGWHLDGLVTAVVGTHTHVQTADERILPKGTACLTDAGMTGPARLDHRRHRRGRARTVRQRDAHQVRGRDRRRAAERRHRHGRSEDRPRDGHRAPQSVGRRGRGARGGHARPVARLIDPRTAAHCRSRPRCPISFRSRSRTIARRRAPTERRVVTVSQLTASIRGLLESGFGDLWVEGEISNCKLWNTGHMYFTLKDGGAQIKAVMYRSAVRYLKFKAEDGLRVIARGRIGVYEPKGEYQLLCDHLQPQGFGALQLAFEQLKKKLQAEGLFDASRKRPLPALPAKIGIVTSLDGAALARHHQGPHPPPSQHPPRHPAGAGPGRGRRRRDRRRRPLHRAACQASMSSSSGVGADRPRISWPSTRSRSRGRLPAVPCRS